MKEIFYGSNNLVYLDISNFNMKKLEYYSNAFSDKDKIIFINVFNVKYDKIASKEFRKTKNIIFICQSEDIIKNKKAINCCDFNFEYNICENMPTIFGTTYIQESTFIEPQSTISSIFIDNNIETTYVPESIFNTYKIETTLIDIPTNNPIIETTSLLKETTIVTSESSTQSISSNENVLPSTDIKGLTNIFKESDLETNSFTKISTSIIKETTGAKSKTSNIIHSTSILTEKDNILTTSLPGKITVLTTTLVDTQQTTSNLFSTSKEEVNEKTTYTDKISSSEMEEIKTSELEKIPTTILSINPKGSTTSKIETTQTKNIGTTGLTTSNVDILETIREKVDSKEINTFNIPTTSQPKSEPIASEPSTSETKHEPTSELSTSERKPEPITSEPSTSERKPEPTTSEPRTSEPKPEPSTSQPKH
jgi:hypothetical protein